MTRDTTHAMSLSFQNKSGETMPAFGLFRIDSKISSEPNGSPIFEAVKPDSEPGVYAVNYGADVVDDGYGIGFRLRDAVIVLTDPDDEPVFGDSLGPIGGQWEAGTGGTGLVALDSPDDAQLAIVTSAQEMEVRLAIIGVLSPPASVLGTPGGGTGAVLSIDPSTGLLIITSARVTITNYDPSLSATDGFYARARGQSGVWEISWLSCETRPELQGLT